jgi:uncharacterized protein YceK
MRKITALFIVCALFVGCASMGGKTGIDQAIQYRAGFNTLLSQWNTELAAMPAESQKEWATKALPIVVAGVTALDTMDIVVGAGGTPTPENVQAYLNAKNKMIDLLASLVLAKKGGK